MKLQIIDVPWNLVSTRKVVIAARNVEVLEGETVRIQKNERSVLAVINKVEDNDSNTLAMDKTLRDSLKVKIGDRLDLAIARATDKDDTSVEEGKNRGSADDKSSLISLPRDEFHIFVEEFKEKGATLHDYGISLVNLQRDLASLQSRMRKHYDKTEAEKKEAVESYRRVISRMLDVLSDCGRLLGQVEKSEKNGLARRWAAMISRKTGIARLFQGTTPGHRTSQAALEYLHKVLLDALKREGIEPMDVRVGQKFDPEIHEVSHRVHGDKLPMDTIEKVLEQGYVQGSEILRKAKVVIVTEEETQRWESRG